VLFSKQIIELFTSYFTAIPASFTLQQQPNNSTHVDNTTSFQTMTMIDSKDNTHMKILLLPPRDWYGKRVTLRSFLEKYATQGFMVSQQATSGNNHNHQHHNHHHNLYDFEVVRLQAIPKPRSPYHDPDDKSIWEVQEALVQIGSSLTARVHHHHHDHHNSENQSNHSSNNIVGSGDMRLVILARRLFLPPLGEDYQDIIYDITIPASVASDAKLKEEKLKHIYDSIKSLTPMPQCYLYDTLCMRAKLEGLRGDEDYYIWAQRSFKLKPELLPLHISNQAQILNSRADCMVQAIVNTAHLKDAATIVKNFNQMPYQLPFDVEKDMCSNVDSPDTISNPSPGHVNNFRAKLARYMAYYTDGACSDSVTFKKLFESMTDPRDPTSASIIRIFNYFLHLRLTNGSYSFDKSLNDQIFDIEEVVHQKLESIFSNHRALPSGSPSADTPDQQQQQQQEEEEQEDPDESGSEINFITKYRRYKCQLTLIRELCSMNMVVFVKLFRLGFFNSTAVRLPPKSLVRLITYALVVATQYEHIVSMTSVILKILPTVRGLKKELCNYAPFLHALCGLYQYDDTSILVSVSKIVHQLCNEGETVKTWFVCNVSSSSIINDMFYNKHLCLFIHSL